MKRWIKLKEKRGGAKYRWYIEKKYRLPDGIVKTYVTKDEMDDIIIFPITSDKKIITVRQFRPGPEKFLIELPAGMMDKKRESHIQAARRELLEETGYSGKIKLIGKIYRGAYSNKQRYVYACVNCKKVQEAKPEQGEFIEIIEMSISEFKNHLLKNMSPNTDASYLALSILNL